MKNVTKSKAASSSQKRTPAKSRPKSPQAPTPTRQPGTPDSPRRRGTKQEKVLKMLRSKSGVTVAAIIRQTGWQQHSVHGFFSGVVRKRLGLTLVSEGEGAGRVYRIAGDRVATGVEAKEE